MTLFKRVGAGIALALCSLSVLAANASVQAVGVKFDPLVVYVEAGDSVTWENMAGHNVETIDQLVPEGTEKVNSELGARVTVTFDNPGVYVYKCTPHWGSRMGGVVVVGKPDELGAIMDGYMELIETEKGELLPAKGLIKKTVADMEENGYL